DFHVTGVQTCALPIYEVKTDYKTAKLDKPLQPKERFFANLSYQTVRNPIGRQWRFDTTLHWQGKQRIPRNGLDPTINPLQNYSRSEERRVGKVCRYRR